jgi:protein O-GlcNAc transferase
MADAVIIYAMTLQENITLDSMLRHAIEALQAGQFLHAEKSCRLAMANGLASSHVQFLLGAALEGQGRLNPALEAFDLALLEPDASPQCWSAKTSVLVKLGRHQDAIASMQQALSRHPKTPDLHSNLGAVYEQSGMLPHALAAYRDALLIDPRHMPALVSMTAVLVKLGQHALAVEQGKVAMSLVPPNIDLYNNLAEAYIQLQRFPEALEICNQALVSFPWHAVMKFKQGLLLSYLQRYDDARKAFSEAQIIDPGVVRDYYPQLAAMAGNQEIRAVPELIFFDVAYHEQMRCDWRYRDAYIEALHTIMLSNSSEMKPTTVVNFGFQMLSLPIAAADRLQLHRRIADIYREIVWLAEDPVYEHNRDHQKIRIGYVSPDFRQHPVGLLSRQIYGLHDRTRFEIYAYSLHKPDKPDDEVTRSIAATCDHFKEVHTLGYRAIGDIIAEDEIDILVDLAGYTTHARPEVFALSAAPVQVAYLGYPSTTGADFIDYAIVDKVVVRPADMQNAWSEAIVRLPNAYCPYDRELDNAAADLRRSDFGLPEQSFVLCCFNNNYKIEPAIFAVWMRMLATIPDAVLWVLGLKADTQQNLLVSAEKAGISRERLVFAGVMPLKEHIKRYQLADLFLDTCWHNAHTTAADALWQGLPVLTCEGPVASSRLASSLLHALDMQDELVTHSLETYEEKAMYYAEHRDALKAVRDKLAANRDTQPLFDTALTVKHLEQAYLAIWARHQAGLAPVAIDIADIREMTV